MHPSELKGFTEHLVDVYTTLHEEVIRLRRENKSLHEELLRQRDQPVEETFSQSKPLKMGADWCIDGTDVLNLSLVWRLRFPSPICSVRISREGCIAFTANKRIFLYKRGVFYAVDESVYEYNPGQMRSDLTESYRCIFEFDEENLIIYWKGSLRKFNEDGECVWEYPVGGVYNVVVRDGKIYVGTLDGIIYIFSYGEVYRKIEHKMWNLRSFVVIGKDIIGITDKDVVLISEEDDNTFETPSNKAKKFARGPLEISEQFRLRGICGLGKTVYYGGELPGIRVCYKGSSISLRETIPISKPLVTIGIWGNRLVAASQDKGVYVWDEETKKYMRITTPDEVIDISGNEDTLCCVDNGGSLRVWKVSEKC